MIAFHHLKMAFAAKIHSRLPSPPVMPNSLPLGMIIA